MVAPIKLDDTELIHFGNLLNDNNYIEGLSLIDLFLDKSNNQFYVTHFYMFNWILFPISKYDLKRFFDMDLNWVDIINTSNNFYIYDTTQIVPINKIQGNLIYNTNSYYIETYYNQEICKSLILDLYCELMMIDEVD